MAFRDFFAENHWWEHKDKGLGLQADRFQGGEFTILKWSEISERVVVMILLALSTSLSMLSVISLALLTLGAALLLVQWKIN